MLFVAVTRGEINGFYYGVFLRLSGKFFIVSLTTTQKWLFLRRLGFFVSSSPVMGTKSERSRVVGGDRRLNGGGTLLIERGYSKGLKGVAKTVIFFMYINKMSKLSTRLRWLILRRKVGVPTEENG